MNQENFDRIWSNLSVQTMSAYGFTAYNIALFRIKNWLIYKYFIPGPFFASFPFNLN